VAEDHCFRSRLHQRHRVRQAEAPAVSHPWTKPFKHCTKGIGIWRWASNDDCGTEPDEPDVVMACCGDIPTKESLAAVEILRLEFPHLKIRFVNVVELFALTQPGEHPHG
jgi:xylulose-5-phosphate/fructose-6-phosphate phosphoketolase